MKSNIPSAIIAGLALMWLAPATSAALVAAWEFNTDANTEGWTTPPSLNITGLTTTGGVLKGTASNNDPQLKLDSINITVGAGETWDRIEFRVRETQNEAPGGTVSFNATGLVAVVNVSSPPLITLATGFTGVSSENGFFTITLDISTFGSVAIKDLRLDPIGGAISNSNSETNGNTFEVDYIRAYTVPEPTAALLGALGLITVIRRRRLALPSTCRH